MASAKLKTHLDITFEDPNTLAVSTMYADALLNATPAADLPGLIAEYDEFVSDVYLHFADFRRLLVSGLVNEADKVALLEKALQGQASELFLSFLRTLARHQRLDLVPAILRQLILQSERRAGRQRVQVTSAVELSPEALQRVQESLAKVLPFQPIVQSVIDPSILGGLKIRVGDTVYDISLRTRLLRLRGRLRERSLHEIQSGRDRFSHPAGN